MKEKPSSKTQKPQPQRQLQERLREHHRSTANENLQRLLRMRHDRRTLVPEPPPLQRIARQAATSSGENEGAGDRCKLPGRESPLRARRPPGVALPPHEAATRPSPDAPSTSSGGPAVIGGPASPPVAGPRHPPQLSAIRQSTGSCTRSWGSGGDE